MTRRWRGFKASARRSGWSENKVHRTRKTPLRLADTSSRRQSAFAVMKRQGEEAHEGTGEHKSLKLCMTPGASAAEATAARLPDDDRHGCVS